VSLHVDSGQLVTLIGANGAGKSTFLMAVSGLIKKTAGIIDLGNKYLEIATPRHRPARRNSGAAG